MTRPQKVIKEGARLRIVTVPAKGEGTYGFGEQIGTSGHGRPQQVFVHASELERSGLASKVAVGTVYVADIAETDRGLRAVNIRPA